MTRERVTPGALRRAARELVRSGRLYSFAVSGGAVGVVPAVWSVAGAGGALLSGRVPYHRSAVDAFIGRSLGKAPSDGDGPSGYASEDAAVALAAHAFVEGQTLLWRGGGSAADLGRVVGVGAAAAMPASPRRRGHDRVHVAVRAPGSFHVGSLDLGPSAPPSSRGAAGRAADLFVLDTVREVVSGGAPEKPGADPGGTRPRLLGGALPAGLSEAAGVTVVTEEGRFVPWGGGGPAAPLVFPGAFDPLHPAHAAAASLVRAVTGREVVFEVAARNADKGSVDPDDVARRLVAFRGYAKALVGHASRFLEKAELYRTDFVTGADTAARIADPRYYHDGDVGRVFRRFRELGTKFYVCARPGFPEPSGLPDDLFVRLPAVGALSSTEIRAAGPGPRGGVPGES